VSQGKDHFDYISWSSASNLEDIWEFFTSIEKVYGKKIINSGLNEMELQKMRNMIGRISKYASFLLSLLLILIA
jgi:hypothetical protein